MTEQLPDLIKSAQDLDRRKWPDFIRTGVLALSEVLPGLNSLLEEFLPDWKAKRFQAFLIELAESIKRLDAKFNQQEAATAEYGLLLEHVGRQVTQTASEEKLKAYRAILLNTCLPSPPDLSIGSRFRCCRTGCPTLIAWKQPFRTTSESRQASQPFRRDSCAQHHP